MHNVVLADNPSTFAPPIHAAATTIVVMMMVVVVIMVVVRRANEMIICTADICK